MTNTEKYNSGEFGFQLFMDSIDLSDEEFDKKYADFYAWKKEQDKKPIINKYHGKLIEELFPFYGHVMVWEDGHKDIFYNEEW